MSSVMIGGLRTIMNGDFEVFAGDRIQWYWTFERKCFRHDGSRKSIVAGAPGAQVVQDEGDPEHDYTGVADPPRPDEPRRIHNDYQYGVTNGGAPADKARHVARIKPYIPDDAQPRLYDYLRVFAMRQLTSRYAGSPCSHLRHLRTSPFVIPNILPSECAGRISASVLVKPSKLQSYRVYPKRPIVSCVMPASFRSEYVTPALLMVLASQLSSTISPKSTFKSFMGWATHM